MNENIDLTKILKDCPKGWKFYSSVYGEVKFDCVRDDELYSIRLKMEDESIGYTTANGKEHYSYNGECILFPSKDQRDWNKFTAPWYKKEKFNPKTLKPFDKVLVRDRESSIWNINMFSYIYNNVGYPYNCFLGSHKYCIPYNNDTKHLVGTTEEAPEYYRYWED